MSPKRSDVLKLKFEGWGGINHTKEQVRDEGQGVGGKQLKNPEESTQGNHLNKKSRDERKHGTSEGKNIPYRKCKEGGKLRKKNKEKQMPDDAQLIH